MHNIPGRQFESWRYAGLPCRAPHTWAYLWDSSTCLVQLGPCSSVHSPVHSTATQHAFVRRIYDCVYGALCQISDAYLEAYPIAQRETPS